MDQLAELRLRKTADLRGTVERRTLAVPQLELRATDDGAAVTVEGYAAATEIPYDIGDPSRGGFTEVLAKGAFTRTLSESPDVILVAQHGRGLSGLPLARTKSGTLKLREDDRGLHFAAELDASDPDVQLLVPKMRRGDVDGASFAFRVTADRWSDDRATRRVTGLTLHQGDVSIVDFGANPAASSQISARAAATAARTVPLDRYRQRVALLRHNVPARSREVAPARRAPIDYSARVAELRRSR